MIAFVLWTVLWIVFGFSAGVTIANIVRKRWDEWTELSLRDDIRRLQIRMEMAQQTFRKQQLMIQQYRWTLYGVIDGDEDLEALVNEQERRDEEVARPARSRGEIGRSCWMPDTIESVHRDAGGDREE